MPIDDLIEEGAMFNTPRIRRLRDLAKEAETEAEQRKFLKALVREIVDAIAKSSANQVDEGVAINNIDEITATLRNEFNRSNSALGKIMQELKLTAKEQTSLIRDIEEKSMKNFKDQFHMVVMKRPRDRVEISNIDELEFPQDVKINNFGDIERYFVSLSKVIQEALKINIPAPQVTVKPADVNIPEVRIPENDLGPIVEAIDDLDKSLEKIRKNSKGNPLAVRLTDGNNWIKELTSKVGKIQTAFQGFQGKIGLQNAQGGSINPATEESVGPPSSIDTGKKTVASAGTAEQLVANATPCRKVIMTGLAGNAGVVYYGGASVSATSGAFLYTGQTQEVEIDDVSKIWIDAGSNADGVQFTYVS